MEIYESILKSQQDGVRLLAVLIDPEKLPLSEVASFVKLVNSSVATHLFVGGSTCKNESIDALILEIKKHTLLPVILFPGSAKQISKKADAVLFLSLLSGRNPDYLIGQQVQAALEIYESDLEVIPTGYLLIDGGKKTSVEKVTKTHPLPNKSCEMVKRTALAAQYAGKKLIYLEAGSGALNPVQAEVITCVNRLVEVPIIVGGGIRNKKQLDKAYNAGATLVVIGTALEEDTAFFQQITKNSMHESFN